jgi:VCBS repeat-containing protein
MKHFAFWLTGLLLVSTDAYCQWPARTAESKNLSVIINRTVNNDIRLNDFVFMLNYRATLSNAWVMEAGISTVERVYTHAVSFASRINSLSSALSVSKSFNNHCVQFSTFTVRDRLTRNAVVRALTGHWKYTFGNSATVVVKGETRNEHVDASFLVTNELEVTSTNYQFKNVTVSVHGNDNRKLSEYVELTLGEHYGFKRQAIRIGERIKPVSSLLVYADVELNRVGDEHFTEGALTRLGVDWKVSRIFTASVFSVHNSFSLYSAFMGFIQYQSGHHSVKLEYRELRDPEFQLVETSGFWFASRIMFRYAFTIS